MDMTSPVSESQKLLYHARLTGSSANPGTVANNPIGEKIPPIRPCEEIHLG